jgi:predicted TIM-barrel fold metal-dependent hydrolase
VRGQGQQGYQKWLASYLSCFHLGMAGPLAALLFGGALERYPGIRIVIGAAGLGWIPHVLERMDAEWEGQFQDLGLAIRPSEYWKRQMYATFRCDETGLAVLDRIGPDNVMWGSDFPHPDGLWPDSRAFLERGLAALAEPVRHKLVYATDARLYGR